MSESEIRAAFERWAGPACRYIAHHVNPDGLSIAYRVDGHAGISKTFEYFNADEEACQPTPDQLIKTAEQIGKFATTK